MKKVLTISLLLLLILTLTTTLVKAATTEAELQRKALELLSKVKTETDYTAAVERFFNEYDFTEEQLSSATAKVEEAEAIIEANGEDPRTYSGDVKDTLVGMAQEAATDLGMKLSVDYNNKVATLTKNGKTVVAVDTETGKIKQTGSDNLLFVVLSGVAVIAVAATVVVKKVTANA